jgi:hypothetical protein
MLLFYKRQEAFGQQRIKLKLQAIFGVTLLGLALLMSGCAGKRVDVKNSGFFKDYDELHSSDNYSAQKSLKEFDMSKYKTILIAPVLVIPAISIEQQTPSQKKLYKEISDYLSDGYKREIQSSKRYKLVETKGADTLILETAVSTVEVHFEDEKWNQFSPIAMDITVTSYNSYIDENVRVLGEKRIVDAATGEILAESMNIVKDEKIILNSDALEFREIKPALDSWIAHIRNYFSK